MGVKCEVTGKLAFTSKAAAMRTVRHFNGRRMRAYFRVECNHWHLTSQAENYRDGFPKGKKERS